MVGNMFSIWIPIFYEMNEVMIDLLCPTSKTRPVVESIGLPSDILNPQRLNIEMPLGHVGSHNDHRIVFFASGYQTPLAIILLSVFSSLHLKG